MIHDPWLLLILFGVGILIGVIEAIAEARIFPNKRRGPRS